MIRIIFALINVLIALIIAPLFDGIERKIKARLQNRRGPPILQTIYDLGKLYRKENIFLGSRLHFITPIIVFSNIFIALLIIPTFIPVSIYFIGDIILLLYLLSSSSLFLVLGSISSRNPFAITGSNREIMLSIGSKLLLALSIGIILWNKGSLLITRLFPLVPPLVPSSILSFIVFIIIAYIESMRLPFDIPEAEPEIAGGILIEYSGPNLALILHSIYLKRILFASLIINFLFYGSILFPGYLGILIYSIIFLALLFIVSIVFTVIEVFCGRYRIDHALKFIKNLSLLMGVIILLALYGY